MSDRADELLRRVKQANDAGHLNCPWGTVFDARAVKVRELLDDISAYLSEPIAATPQCSLCGATSEHYFTVLCAAKGPTLDRCPLAPKPTPQDQTAQPERDKARREWIRDLRAYASGSGGTRIDSGECVELADLLDAPAAASEGDRWASRLADGLYEAIAVIDKGGTLSDDARATLHEYTNG